MLDVIHKEFPNFFFKQMFWKLNKNLKIRLKLITVAGKVLPQFFYNEEFYPHYCTYLERSVRVLKTNSFLLKNNWQGHK